MQSTQLVCPHCGSTLTFGVAISPGAAVECLICRKTFTAANPVSVAVTVKPSAKSAAAPKANPKPAPTTFSTTPLAPRPAKARKQKPKVRPPVEANGNFLLIAVSIAFLLLLTGGISFAVWKSKRSTEPGPPDPEELKIAKGGGPTKPVDKNPVPVEGKKPQDGGGKPLATNDDDDDDIRAKFQAEMKQVLKRKAPSTVDSKEPEVEVTAPPLPKNAVAGLDQEKINGAIWRGIVYLRRTQTREGSWTGGGHDVGYTALCGLTLLECKVPAGDPAIQRAAAFIRPRCASIEHNYQASLAILFLDRLGDANDRAAIQGLALRLMAGQDDAGGWTYGTPQLGAGQMYQLFAFMRPSAPLHNPIANPTIRNPNDPFQQLRFLLLTKGLDTENHKVNPKNPPKVNAAPPVIQPDMLEAKLQGLQIVRNRGKRKGEIATVPNVQSDNSNTQFALLALWAARRHGVPTDQALLAGYQRFATTQNLTDHGWGYGGPGVSTTTMTCVGLIGLGIGHGAAPDREGPDPKASVRPALQDPGIRSGLERLARNIGQPSPDATKTDFPMENLYFLWSVERVAMLYDLSTIGGKDWYGWGAQILIHNQQADGAWGSDPKTGYHGFHRTLDTCFALLFLKRSNLVQDLTHNLRLNTGVRDP